jgi:hypothetical protein
MRDVRISDDGGLTFVPVTNPIQTTCLAERPTDGDLFACSNNWADQFYALGRSTDGQAWTKVFSLDELDGDLDCPPTSGHETKNCPSMLPECQLMGNCDGGPPPPIDAGADGPPGAPDGGIVVDPPCEGCCCDVGGAQDGGRAPGRAGLLGFALAIGVLGLALVRR